MFNTPTIITRFLFSAFLTLAVLAIPQPVLADINKAQASAIAKKRSNGKVLKVTATRINKKSVFRVKVLKSSGKVIHIVLDAKTGSVIGKSSRAKGKS